MLIPANTAVPMARKFHSIGFWIESPEDVAQPQTASSSDASNTDPFATTPKPGDQWVDTGPHVMVLNIGNRFAGYPTTPDNTKRPYVMYPNTPYAHLMIPVK